jgi:hypothetical protein
LIGTVRRDERERAIDAEAERLVAAVLSFGILVLVVVRSLRGEAAWDLLALVIAGGGVGMLYRARRQAVDRRMGGALALTMAVAAVAAAVLVAVLAR